MFNGVPDQFHQFGPSLPFPPLSFPLHHQYHHNHNHGLIISPPTTPSPTTLQNFNPSLACFDLYHPPPPPPSLASQLQQYSCIAHKKDKEESNNNNVINNNVAVVVHDDNDDDRSMYHHHHHHESSAFDDLWSNEEVVALFKIRSGLENWFHDFTWDHVSRKLAELGYQRSGEKCKEKFDEESCRQQLNDMNNYNKNYRFLTELNEFNYHHVELPQIIPQKPPIIEEEKGDLKKKKKKRKKVEKFMGYCGNIVKKVIEKQEEMHNKVLEDILKREEESIAREEAWRNQEISKIQKEIENRASSEKAKSSEREAQIAELLKNFIPPSSLFDQDQTFFKKMQDLFMSSSTSTTTQILQENPENFSGVPSKSRKMESFEEGSSSNKDIIGKRWPRDEVLALINIRCKVNNNSYNNDELDKDCAGNKGPLWERISKGMMEMGYKRSAKRCKEKWENINKYFRKTKDIKKKRADDSRTCPYFQQLSSLYSLHQHHEEEEEVVVMGHSDALEK